VIAAVRQTSFQGIAYVRPAEWDAKGDNTAAVIFVNVVDGERFKEIDQIVGSPWKNVATGRVKGDCRSLEHDCRQIRARTSNRCNLHRRMLVVFTLATNGPQWQEW